MIVAMMFRRRFALRAALCLGVAAACAGASAAPPVRVGIEADGPQAEHLQQQVGGDNCARPDDYRFSNPASPSRMEAELLLLCNALRLGGYDAPIAFVFAYNYNRALSEAVAGRIDLPTQSVWAAEIAEHADALLSSEPLIAPGEWVVGLYTTQNRADVLAADSPEKVRRLVAAAPRGWVEDWRALETLGLRGLIDVQENQRIPAMIAAGHADFTLRNFSANPDMGHALVDPPLRMLPIRGVKLGFPTSRHFAISRARPDAEALKAALDRGIAALRASGALDRVMAAVGLRDARVKDWVAIAPPALAERRAAP